MELPVVIINLKAYPQFFEKTNYFVETVRKIRGETGVNIMLVPPFTFLKDFSKTVPVLAQAIDPKEPGAHTGHVTAEEIKRTGAVGTLINHAEKQISRGDIAACVQRCKDVGLSSIVCSANNSEALELAKLIPDFISIEPPELIGKKSVMDSNPDIVKKTVSAVKSVSNSGVLCGAGIRSRKDVRKALELGTAGVMLSSFIMKNDDIEGAIREVVNGCN